MDEADRFTRPSLEQLRDRYDHRTFGLSLLGMPGLEHRFARSPPLSSRIGCAHALRPVSQEAMQDMLGHDWVERGLGDADKEARAQEAIAALLRITGGTVRLLHRLLAQINRILYVNDLHTVTQEVVEAARTCLVIGTTSSFTGAIVRCSSVPWRDAIYRPTHPVVHHFLHAGKIMCHPNLALLGVK